MNIWLTVGFTAQVAPMYNAEMAPAHLRGGMNVLFQLSVTVGILAAGLINYGCDFIHPWGWRLSLGLAGESSNALPLNACQDVQLHASIDGQLCPQYLWFSDAK